MKVKFKPEHAIVSDTIEADGFRGLTLRLLPKDRFTISGELIHFLTVVGGCNKYPQLTPVRFWEITGNVELESISYRHNVWKEAFIDITDIRQLGGKERKYHMNEASKMWADYYAEG